MIRALTSLALVLAAGACSKESRTFGVTIGAEPGGNAPFTVDERETSVRLARGRTVDHALVFESTQAIVLDDIRWTFASVRDGRVFATAGHGCGPSIATDKASVQFACTEDFRFLSVKPGSPLTEAITLFGGLEDGPVATGRLVFRQPIAWWYASGDPLEPRGRKGGEVTVSLTYEVRAR